MTVGFCTLGCKTNAYDTQAMRELFLAHGFECVPFSQADICIVNTCTVTAVADKKSRQMLRRAVSRGARVIAAGCMAQRDGEKLLELGVYAVIGTADRARIVDIATEGGADVRSSRGETDFEELAVSGSGEHTRAYLKVQEGCDNFCTYCAIPYVRGRSRSRSFDPAVNEAARLHAAGYKEIVITGIHIDDYVDGDKRLIDLIEAAAAAAPGGRLRLGSLHKKCFDGDFLARAKDVPELCRHFHISLQSGSAAVLAAMNRLYTPEEYYACVCDIRTVFPDAAITTDVIAGFPGETDDQHAQTLAFIEKCGFSRVHVFPYSAREGTAAAKLAGQVPKAVREQRAAELTAAAAKLETEYMKSCLGRCVEVLTETEEGGLCCGYTREYVRARIAAQPGQIKAAVPTGVSDGCLTFED